MLYQWMLYSTFHQQLMDDYRTVLSLETGKGDEIFYSRVGLVKMEVSNIVSDSVRGKETETPLIEIMPGLGFGTCWNLLWTWTRPKLDFDSLIMFQMVNHFAHSTESSCDKICLRIISIDVLVELKGKMIKSTMQST